MMMTEYERYAVYYAPKLGCDLRQFGCSWLGWDPDKKTQLDRPVLDGLSAIEIENATLSATRYGFHGTLKPPFRLAEGKNLHELDVALQGLAENLSPVVAGALKVQRLGRFLALVPSENMSAIGVMASQCVAQLDMFRAPASPNEIAKRRAKKLSARQDELLLKWGYPYVMDEFRFHLTLSDVLEDELMHRVYQVLEKLYTQIATQPFVIEDICLFGDPGQGAPFHFIKRYSL